MSWRLNRARFLIFASALAGPLQAEVILETTSAYHHIRVIDEDGVRTLSFDGSMETRMSLADPLQGHFEYTEYFHMPWLWIRNLTNVLMIGLGGGSTQRAYQHYYPKVSITTVELDPMVVRIAREYFQVRESPTHKILVEDGRVHLRRSRATYQAIILDAYVQSRYGASIPHQLVTREFFELAREHLAADGVLAYNVMGRLEGRRADLLGAIYKTLQAVFPQVYLFPCAESENVVLLATRVTQTYTSTQLHQRTTELTKAGHRFPPRFRDRIYSFRKVAPFAAYQAPVLTDDHAPVDGLMRVGE